MQDPVHISASLFDPEFCFSQSRCDCANKRDRSVPTCRKSRLNAGCPTVCAVGTFVDLLQVAASDEVARGRAI